MMVNYLVLNESNLVDIYENELDLLIEKNKEKIDNYVKNSDLFLRQDFMKLFNGYIEKNKINSCEHLRQNCKLATCIQGIINGFGGNVYDQVIKHIETSNNKGEVLDNDQAWDKFRNTSEKIKNNEVFGFNYTNSIYFVEFVSDNANELEKINNRALSTVYISNFDKIKKYNSITPESVINDLKNTAKNDGSITKDIHPALKVLIETEIIEESLDTDIIQTAPKKRNRL
ncbi:hypothetical protein NDU68_004656 [Salmonella enterica]|nr:hypothetical protein [Salmonella enterica]EJA7008797.1 hypothetical protein [Salmonella enterica]EJB3030317.1 hypothetical protein [Salmonella enterica]EJB7994249.1 hypothetical protein [Salmonella enterica]EJH3066166.1 hypothetical protein [Salmonella enterica]